MLRDALDAFVRRDIDLAQHVLNEDDRLDALKTQIFRELLTYMLQDPSTIEPALDLILSRGISSASATTPRTSPKTSSSSSRPATSATTPANRPRREACGPRRRASAGGIRRIKPISRPSAPCASTARRRPAGKSNDARVCSALCALCRRSRSIRMAAVLQSDLAQLADPGSGAADEPRSRAAPTREPGRRT